MTNISLRQFSKEIGKSHPWVTKLIQAGIIPRNEDGTIPLEDALEAYRAYEQSPKNPRGRPAKGTQLKHSPLPVYEAKKQEQTEQSINVNSALNKAKLADTTFKAKIRELEFKFKAGELLDKNEVAAEAQWLAEQVKSKLLAIPPRVSALCEGRIAREIEEIIADAINQALTELQKLRYKQE